MLHLLVTAIPLAVGVTIALLAAWRRWAPPLGVAVAVGAGLRLFIAVIAWRDSWQPPPVGISTRRPLARTIS